MALEQEGKCLRLQDWETPCKHQKWQHMLRASYRGEYFKCFPEGEIH